MQTNTINSKNSIPHLKPEPGKLITFGKHKGKTIEQLHFIDFSWLNWAMGMDNMSWIKRYVENLPTIYPKKIEMRCGDNHSYGCKKNTATMITLPVDRTGQMIVENDAVYFWCSECIRNSDYLNRENYSSLSLEFSTHIQLLKRNDMNGFSEILKRAYGIKRLSKQAAWDVFWKGGPMSID